MSCSSSFESARDEEKDTGISDTRSDTRSVTVVVPDEVQERIEKVGRSLLSLASTFASARTQFTDLPEPFSCPPLKLDTVTYKIYKLEKALNAATSATEHLTSEIESMRALSSNLVGIGGVLVTAIPAGTPRCSGMRSGTRKLRRTRSRPLRSPSPSTRARSPGTRVARGSDSGTRTRAAKAASRSRSATRNRRTRIRSPRRESEFLDTAARGVDSMPPAGRDKAYSKLWGAGPSEYTGNLHKRGYKVIIYDLGPSTTDTDLKRWITDTALGHWGYEWPSFPFSHGKPQLHIDLAAKSRSGTQRAIVTVTTKEEACMVFNAAFGWHTGTRSDGKRFYHSVGFLDLTDEL